MTTPTDAPTSLTARAITVARRHRDTAPREFADRHIFRLQWDRRAITAANIATALDVGIDAVMVRDDPDRQHGIGTGTTPGDLMEVTSEDGRCWYFIQDLTGLDPLWGWLLLGPCPFCGATAVPIAQIASLVDLGDHLDPDHGGTPAPDPFHGDPGHHQYCFYAPNRGARESRTHESSGGL
ncbi:SH3 domain-containing protein [Amycolatopsis palatopharyngis]|uniref:SH3 domain-containing protein n=1 Tax=Amycolatopsis palatopharyngis TaxID=187982 RepID=UPI000E278ACE|nr:SH3 domain-containing protein [Amycolatopsis palatopharyngis]